MVYFIAIKIVFKGQNAHDKISKKSQYKIIFRAWSVV